MRLLLASFFLVFLFSGCSSPKTSYYMLSASPIAQSTNTSAQTVRLMVGPVSLPDSVDQPQLVVNSSNNEIEVFKYDRWAGSLKADVGRVIAANLARELDISNIWSFSQSTQTNFDFQILIDVQNLHSKLGENVFVDVLWTIKPAAGSSNALVKRSDIKNPDKKNTGLNPESGFTPKTMMGRSSVHEPVTHSGVDALVAAQSRAFAKVSREIASSIR